MAQSAQKDSKQVVVELTMSLDEARQFIWQGARAPREPMGKLLDSKQLDWSDLAWAAQVGYDPKFREAARTLLAHRIGKPITAQYGPKVIEGSRYLEDKKIENIVYTVAYMAIGVMAAVGFVISLISDLLQGKFVSAPILAIVVIALTAGLIFFIFHLSRKHLLGYRSFRAGSEGEETITNRLRSALDNRWTIFRNLHLPGHDDDIDIVLVGPGGVWAVSVKSSKATLRVEGKKWNIQTKKGWSATSTNPSDEITKSAFKLNDFLKRQGIVRYVERAVALATDQPVTNFELSEIPIWLLPTIENKASALDTRTPPTEQEIKKIMVLFNELTTKQIAKEEAQYKR